MGNLGPEERRRQMRALGVTKEYRPDDIETLADALRASSDEDWATELAGRFRLRGGNPDEVAAQLFDLALDAMAKGESIHA